jgi:hypothetical protein
MWLAGEVQYSLDASIYPFDDFPFVFYPRYSFRSRIKIKNLQHITALNLYDVDGSGNASYLAS